MQSADAPDTTPADTSPADTSPADTSPADTSPADTSRADTAAVVPAVVRGSGRAGVATGRAQRSATDTHGPGGRRVGAIEVRRSPRRRRTVTAYREDDRTIVLIPASFSAAEERRWVAQMVAKLETREDRRRRTLGSDDELAVRARQLSETHLGGVLPTSVRWVDNQQRRWGSCTPADRTIRLSSRLRGMPEYVVDYVLVHELAHLVEPAHDAAFWALVGRYPQAERALGFLEGVESRLGAVPDGDGDDTD